MRTLFFLIVGSSLIAQCYAQDERKDAIAGHAIEVEVTAAINDWIKRTGRIIVTPEPLSTATAAFDIKAIILKELDSWPVIKLVVVPSPPRDYSITINGNSFPATERSEYAVSPGTNVKMIVTRSDYPPCRWDGRVIKNEQVICRLP